MKINFMSDIHLEFGLLDNDLSGDVLILAGDICVKNKQIDWIEDIASRFNHVIYVMGNHEFYGGSIEKVMRLAKEHFKDSNVIILDNEMHFIDNVLFIGGTLWSDFDNGNYTTMERSRTMMNDFHKIRLNNYRDRFTPNIALKEHMITKLFLNDNVVKDSVVVTHHAPTYLSIAPQFKGDALNGAYCSDLSGIMLDKEPKYWFHGHIHHASDYMIGNTRVLCNPRGYDQYELVSGFDINKYVEI